MSTKRKSKHEVLQGRVDRLEAALNELKNPVAPAAPVPVAPIPPEIDVHHFLSEIPPGAVQYVEREASSIPAVLTSMITGSAMGAIGGNEMSAVLAGVAIGAVSGAVLAYAIHHLFGAIRTRMVR